MTLSRRGVIAGLGALAAVPGLRAPAPRPEGTAAAPVHPPAGLIPGQVARDEGFWRTVAGQFSVSPDFVNLENGYYGIMPDPVRLAYHRNVNYLNENSSHLLRTTYKPRAELARERIAALAGVSPQEIAFTRCGTEALQNLIGGYNKLRPGDAVMYSDLDYYQMQYAMNWLTSRRGVQVEQLAIPEPVTRQKALDAYARAFRDHPKVRLLLLSHMNNRTGLVLPVRDIVAMARERGIDVIVDAAHSWAHLDFTIPQLGADFAGVSLHKWLGMPLGSGFLYIRKSRLGDIDPAFADESYPSDDIRIRTACGTEDFATFLTTDPAVDFHRALGGAVKQARLRYLRDRWVHQVLDIPDLQILTPEDPSMYGAITSFRVTGRTSHADNKAISAYLFDRHRIFTVERDGPVKGCCVRVTPALYNSRDDVDRLAQALRDTVARFRR